MNRAHDKVPIVFSSENISRRDELFNGTYDVSFNGWAIILYFLEDKNYAAYVNRCKNKLLWWVSDDSSLIKKFHSKESARYVLTTFKHKQLNRIVPFNVAKELIEEQWED